MHRMSKRIRASLESVGVVGLVLAVILFGLLLWLAPQYQAASVTTDPEKRFTVENEARRTLAQILGGGVFIIGVWFTWRQLKIAQEGQITERFTRAIDQLGNKSPELRLGAVYALERIARDSRRDHWPTMEILAAYLREHAPWGDMARRGPPTPDRGDDRVVIQAILTVLRRRKLEYEETQQHLNLSRVDLHGMSLVKVDLSGADLSFSNFTAALLREARLDNCDLTGASFAQADLSGASLLNAKVSDEQLRAAKSLKGATMADGSRRDM